MAQNIDGCFTIDVPKMKGRQYLGHTFQSLCFHDQDQREYVEVIQHQLQYVPKYTVLKLTLLKRACTFTDGT
jgi:hypothetical protein